MYFLGAAHTGARGAAQLYAGYLSTQAAYHILFFGNSKVITFNLLGWITHRSFFFAKYPAQ